MFISLQCIQSSTNMPVACDAIPELQSCLHFMVEISPLTYTVTLSEFETLLCAIRRTPLGTYWLKIIIM